MKRVLIVIFLCNCTRHSIAQNDKPKFGENHFIYVTVQLNSGNYNFPGAMGSVEYVYKNKYSVKVSDSFYNSRPKNNPNNHRPYDYRFDPIEQFGSGELLLGKVYVLSNAGTIRANLSAGIGFSTFRKAVYERWSFAANNYLWHYEYKHSITFIINPKIEFMFTRVVGVTFSPVLNINNQKVYFGAGTGIMYGLLRAKKSHYNAKTRD